MNFRRYNCLSGAASIFGERRSFQEAVADAEKMAALRAQVESISLMEATTRYFAERRLGQFLFAGGTLGSQGLCLVLAIKDAAPDWVLVVLAMLPAVVFGAVLVAARKIQSRMLAEQVGCAQ